MVMARLILTINNKVISSHKVTPEQPLTIGRHPDNHICIDHLSVSAHHAAVRLEDRKLTITDLGSSNGTFVNHEQVSEGQLAHQDWITIGKHICIVDLYDSLSLEATQNELTARSSGRLNADQTMILNRDEVQAGWLGFDYLSFLSAGREDHELADRTVAIGKNKDAQIRIGGLWSILAGAPSATITKIHDDYILEHVGGLLKPRVNGTAIRGATKLSHQDIIKIGPVEVQIRCVRRPSK
ncbi:MAG: FHA domain-containing protein [Desulfobacteraceae bacterium]|nr:MAG: FHA domain-containing protein [Desulfobacteraceae bacterium]